MLARFIFAVAIISCPVVSSLANEKLPCDRKHYLALDAIQISDGQIMVKAANKLFKIKTLRSDKQGLFIYKRDVKQEALKWERGPNHYHDAYSNLRSSSRSRRH